MRAPNPNWSEGFGQQDSAGARLLTAPADSRASGTSATAACPDFFIVGAPRCGTTSLSRYLSKHPQICFSRPKEPHFFSFATNHGDKVDLAKDYFQRFFPHFDPKRHLVLGEGSVSYLYSPEAIRRILAVNPRAKFIVSVRNPIEMVRSYHSRLLYILDEDVRDLAQAWALQDERAEGRRLPRACRDPRLLQYREIGALGRQVERLFAIAGRERCKVVLFDDLIADPRGTYCEILDFLGVEDDGRTRFSQKRRTRRYRHPLLQRLTVRPPRGLVSLLRLVQSQLGAKRLDKRLRRRMRRLNTEAAHFAKVDSEMRQTLATAFVEDVRLLGRLLDRDLSAWQLEAPAPRLDPS